MYPNSPIKIRNSSHPLWPRWFLLSNYECLYDLTIEEFLSEIERRLFFFNQPLLPSGRKLRDDKVWIAVERGFPLISENKSGWLSRSVSDSVTPINHIDLLCSAEAFKQDQKDVLGQLEPEYTLPVFSGEKRVLVALDLELYDDETIIKQFTRQLRQIRETVGIQEPIVASAKKAAEKTLRKFLSYQAIPYLDLLLYSQTHKQLNDDEWRPLNLTQGALHLMLFKDVADIEQLKKTYLPFFKENLLDTNFINRLFSNIRLDSELLSRKVSAL